MHSESQWRYRAYRRGLKLVKYKQDSPAYSKYGPYALFDQSTNRMAAMNWMPRPSNKHCSPAPQKYRSPSVQLASLS